MEQLQNNKFYQECNTTLAYDLNGNRTSDTRYGQQVTTQELTGYDESGSPIVTRGYANRRTELSKCYLLNS